MTVRGPAKRKGDRVSSPSLAQQAYLFEQDKLGKGWLGDDAKKDHGFYVLRLATAAMPPDAVILVSPTNMFKATAKAKAVAMANPGFLKRMQTDTPEQRRERVAEGLLELIDSVTAVAQTPERVCTCAQRVDRGGAYVGQPQVMFFDQAQFDGRMKMFGAEIDEPDLEAIADFREALERYRKERTQQ
jgi:hypothetical protein